MFLLLFALALVVLGVLLRNTSDDVLQACGYWCYGFAVVLVVIASSVSCASSPTAPTTTRRLAWSAAPGCTPNQPLPKRRTQEPLVAIQVPGDLLRATWLNSDGSTLTVNFRQQVNGVFLLCSWEEK